MKIALKYGIAVALLIAAWVAVKHFVLHFEGTRAQIADVVIFNLAAIIGLTLGIKSKRAANGGWLNFLEGWKTGILIAVTYAILTSLYFAFLLAVVGPKIMQPEGETSMLKAFLGVSVAFSLMGTFFAAIIALMLRKKPAMNVGGC